MRPETFPLSRMLYIAFSALISLVGLFAASAAQDEGFALFGYGLMLFGVCFAFSLIKRGYDEAEGARS